MGFRAKLTLMASLLIAAIGLFFTLFIPAEQESAAQSILEQRAMQQAAGIGSLLLGSLEFKDADDAARQLELVRKDSDILYAVVMLSDGAEFVRYTQPGNKAVQVVVQLSTAPSIYRSGSLLHATMPILSEDSSVLGNVNIGFSLAAATKAKETSRRQAFFISLFILGLGIAIVWWITKPLVGTAIQLSQVSSELSEAARDQESSTAQQGAAVEETRQAMSTLLSTAQEIASRSSDVLGNTERSMQRSREIANRIDELGGMLANIEKIAEKTNILALNAALEGTKAGEAGKGFTLVAAEMRRLAEVVVEMAAGIRKQMREMQVASEASVSANRDGTVSSQEIAGLTQQQRQATEAVMSSMDEMAKVLGRTIIGIQRSTKTANTVTDLASVLTGMIASTDSSNRGALPSRAH